MQRGHSYPGAGGLTSPCCAQMLLVSLVGGSIRSALRVLNMTSGHFPGVRMHEGTSVSNLKDTVGHIIDAISVPVASANGDTGANQ